MSNAMTNTTTDRDSTGRTKIRHVRVPDVIWVDAARQAQTEGMTISELVRDLLRDYNAGKRMS